MEATPSRQISGHTPREEQESNTPHTTTPPHLAAARLNLASLSAAVAQGSAAGFGEQLSTAVDRALGGLDAIKSFLDEAKDLRSITNFKTQHAAACNHASEIIHGLPSEVLDLLPSDERARVTTEFAPLVVQARELERALHRESPSLTKTVLENQEHDYVRSGLLAIEHRVAKDLDLVLQKQVGLLQETRALIVDYFKAHFVRPCVTPLEDQPLTGNPSLAALNEALTRLQQDKQFDIAPGQKILLAREMGNPEILRALVDAKDHLAYEVRELSRSSVLRADAPPNLPDLLRPHDIVLRSGLRARFDYAWGAVARSEACQLTLQSPFGDGASYRFELKPQPGEEGEFRRTIVALMRDMKAFATTPPSADSTRWIVSRLHELGGEPLVEAAPLRSVTGLLDPTDSARKVFNSPREILDAVERTLAQRFTFEPMTFGSEGADPYRINTLELEIECGRAVVKLNRKGYTGKEFAETPSLVLSADSTVEALRAVGAVRDLLKESRGDLNSAAGKQALELLLHVERERHDYTISNQSVFAVEKIANLRVAGLEDLHIRLTSGGSLTNSVFRGCTLRISNPLESAKETIVSDISADAASAVTLELTGASLTRLNLSWAHLLCRGCNATEVAINALSPESKRAWEDNGNRFDDPTDNRIVEPLTSRFSRILSGAHPTYRVVSRSNRQ